MNRLQSLQDHAGAGVTGSICLALIAGFVTLSFPGQVVAQSDEPDSEPLEMIVVTATRREENIQDVPSSVSAVSGGLLEKLGLTDVQGVARRTPGLQYGNFTDLKLATTAIRGVNPYDASSAGKDPSVAYYLDEVYLGLGVGASIDYFDLERIEVLRGPQGTLFGRNAIGGVINITSRRPTNEFGGNAQLEFGDYDYMLARAALNMPVKDDVFAIRVAASYIENGGYTDNAFLNVDTNDSERTNLRFSALYTPSDKAEFLFTADYRDVKQHSKQYETVEIDTDSVWYMRATGEIPGLPAVPINTDPDDRKVYSDVIAKETLDGYGLTLRATFDLGELDLVSVTGYREHDYYNVGDTDMSPLSILTDGDPEDTWRISQELRLVDRSDGRFTWIGGVYYYKQDTDNLSFVTVGDDLSILLLGDDSIGGLETGSTGVVVAEGWGLFGSGTYDLTDRTSLTVGARYTRDNKEIDFAQFDPIDLLGGTYEVEAEDDWNAFTPSVSLQTHFNDNVMGYVLVSQGYKSGGFNDALGAATTFSFDQETLWNYELGVKSMLADGRVRLNASYFHMEWDDIQLQEDDPSTPAFDPRTSNAGKATSEGIEAELIASLGDNWTLSLNGTVIDAKFDEGALPTAPGEPAVPLNHMTRVPDYTVNFRADYERPFSSNLLFLASAEWYSQGEMYLTLDNQEAGVVDPYSLVNAQIGIGSADGRWQVVAWGRNLTDELYRERLFDIIDIPFVGQKFADLGQPATYGLRLLVEF